MAQRPSLDDYVDVAERIQDFKDAYPNGSLQTISWRIADVGGKQFVVYHARAIREPGDRAPGEGIAWEPFPGQTPYTKNSELMNAETAAWGRAIVALGLVANRKLASRQEVRNRTEEARAEDQAAQSIGPGQDVVAVRDRYAHEKAPKAPVKVKTLTAAQVKTLKTKLANVDPLKVQLAITTLGADDLASLTAEQANALVKKVAA